MATIYLASHAHSEKGEGAPLTKHGIEQARMLGEWIGQNITHDLSLVVTSPAWRAYDTIAVALKATQFTADIRVDHRLSDLDHRKAEDTQAVGDRMFEWTQQTLESYGKDAVVLAGTHEMAIRCLAAKIFKASDRDMNGYRINEASMNVLTIGSTFPTMDLDVSAPG